MESIGINMEEIEGIDLKKLVEECEAEFEEERPLRECQRDKRKLFMKKWEDEPPCPWMRPY